MNQDPSTQGNSFVQVPQKQTKSQSIFSSLANPTKYHLAEKSKRIITSNGAPPTPNNSFQNNTLSSNNFADSSLDPQLLQQYHQQQQLMSIKQESAHSEYDDFDTQTQLSPLSTTACNSPHEQGFASPSGNSFDDLCRSFKPSHLDSMMYGGGSANPLPTNSFPTNSFPTNSLPANTYYADNFPSDNYTNTDDFLFPGEVAMSAPTTSPIGPVDVKANVNNPKINFNNRQLHNNLNNLGGHVNNISHSLPTISNAPEWQYGGSLDSNYTPLQFNNSGEIQNYESVDNDKEALASEKRRRRRESHNAVERRRRDNINEKIQELSTLLPDLYVDSANKPNKGVILRKSVDYIRHLQHIYEQERSRSSKLESQVRELSSQPNNPGSGSNGSDSSGGGNIFGTSMP